METHVMMVQYLIRPVDMIPSNFHTSPRFVRSFWNINCGAKPQWVVDDAASVSVTHVVKDLESRVRVCAAYAKRLMNLAVVSIIFLKICQDLFFISAGRSPVLGRRCNGIYLFLICVCR
jgi:hypothetical protein